MRPCRPLPSLCKRSNATPGSRTSPPCLPTRRPCTEPRPSRIPDGANRDPRSLYRRALKLSLDWAVHRSVWRGQALYIRSLFEANRGVADPRQRRVRDSAPPDLSRLSPANVNKALLSATEKLLDEWKHPEPYIPPCAPGGRSNVVADTSCAWSLMPRQGRNTRETSRRHTSTVSLLPDYEGAAAIANDSQLLDRRSIEPRCRYRSM